MSTFNLLPLVLEWSAPSSPKQPLSDAQYKASVDILEQGLKIPSYRSFIIPQLTQSIHHLLKSRTHISVLEIGPGPTSALADLSLQLRQKVDRYVAFESRQNWAIQLDDWLVPASSTGTSPLPSLSRKPLIHRTPFSLKTNPITGADADDLDWKDRFDLIIFRYSIHGLKPQDEYIKRSFHLLSGSGMVVVFHHHNETLDLDGLLCSRVALFPSGAIGVLDNDPTMEAFSSVITGFCMQNEEDEQRLRMLWRNICRTQGRKGKQQDSLWFSSPDIMLSFTHAATRLSELAPVPLMQRITGYGRTYPPTPAVLLKPTKIHHVQKCVDWARYNQVSLLVLDSVHRRHYWQPNVLAIDMRAFDQVEIVTPQRKRKTMGSDPDTFVVVGAGCKTKDIVHKTKAAGVTVPLGAEPGESAVRWLQGGIGPLSRVHGLACDAIVGAVMVCVKSGQILRIGYVPSKHCPSHTVRPENEADLLWAIKGAGTNFGIIISLTFKACAAPTFSINSKVFSLTDKRQLRRKLDDFDEHMTDSSDPKDSVEAQFYWEEDQLRMRLSFFTVHPPEISYRNPAPVPRPVPVPPTRRELQQERVFIRVVTNEQLLSVKRYMSWMHNTLGLVRTSSIQRCLFLKRSEFRNIIEILEAAIAKRPTPFCQLRLIQGGGAIGEIAPDSTAFGCRRDWDFACIIIAVWCHHNEEISQQSPQWVYDVASDLLPWSCGVYGADLGPDPRDIPMVAKAFGQNGPRLTQLKRVCDPQNMLQYACPVLHTPPNTSLILLVTGEDSVRKQCCIDTWVSVFKGYAPRRLTASVVDIRQVIKEEYAIATGADLHRLS